MSREKKTSPKKKKIINLYDMYEEKRDYPRVSVNSIAVVHKKDKYDVNLILYDISPDGVQLRCNRKTAYLIHPTGKFITEKTAPEIILKFALPIDGKKKDVIVQSKIFYFTLIDTDVVAFGARFKKFEKFTQRHVDEFIRQSIIPVETKVLDILHTPHTDEDILDKLDDPDVNLGDTLNLLRRKKAIVSYEHDNTRKFIKLESAIASIFERLDKIEKRLDKKD